MRVGCVMAGVGSRLGDLTRQRHKAMLPINGRPVLDHQIGIFRAAGLTDVTFVLGHGAGEVAHTLFNSLSDLCFTIKHNAAFIEKNLDWSAYLALSDGDGPVFYYEGDLLVPPSLLRQLTASEADICLAVDTTISSMRPDTMLTATRGKPERIIFREHGVVSDLDDASAVGELICMMKLSDRARRRLVDLLGRQSFVGEMRMYQLLEQMFATFDTDFVTIGDRPWVEVDNAEDLKRAERLMPDILSA